MKRSLAGLTIVIDEDNDRIKIDFPHEGDACNYDPRVDAMLKAIGPGDMKVKYKHGVRNQVRVKDVT